MRNSTTQFNPATVAFEVDESTPLSRLLSALRDMVREYPAGRGLRGDREVGPEIPAARWCAISAGNAVGIDVDFDRDEGSAYDYRTRAAKLIEESGSVYGETSIEARAGRYSVIVLLDAGAV